jgi:glycosyltransferase involved in cell wall biosynthesis
MRIAFFTPLNPVRSGISDYSEELLPFLGELADIDIVANCRPETEAIRRRFPVLSPDQFLQARKSYDCVFYQIGNNYPSHGYMLPCLAAVPGIAVLHDYSLTYLILPATVGNGDYRSLREIVQPSLGARAGAVARKLLFGVADPYQVSLARPVIEMSQAVIVHNRHSYERLAAEFPDLRIQLIPHATPMRGLPGDPAALRAAYGFKPDDLILASLSTVAYNKRMDLMFTALQRLRAKHPSLKFVIVGAGELGASAALIRRYGLGECVVQTGWATPQSYLDYIDLADVAVDLRHPTAGETSGSALRAMQAGKPLVVSAEGSFIELPDECCIRVPVGHAEVVGLYDALDALLSDRQRRLEMGAAGRRFAHSNLQIRQAAASYFALAREIASSGLQPRRMWSFRPAEDRSASGRMVSSAYKLGRLVYYWRRYGLNGTLKRIRNSSR